MGLLYQELTDVIIKTFYEVYNELGYGFLEKVYQNSLYLELKNKGYNVEAQKRIIVYYKGVEVGEYFADLIVENAVILELKAADCFIKDFENQILNYLRATDCEEGLLLNFGKKTNSKEKYMKITVKQETITPFNRHQS